MFELTLWKDQEIRKLRRDMDRLFDRMCNGFGFAGLREFVNLPRFDVSETEDDITVEIHIPGVDPDNMELSVTSNTLTLKGRRRQETLDHKEGRRWVEQRYDSFSRTFRLPCTIRPDDVEAVYGDETLKIVLPKTGADRPRGVKVQVRK